MVSKQLGVELAPLPILMDCASRTHYTLQNKKQLTELN